MNSQKTIGLIGGMSWESSALYYRHINTLVRSRLGAQANARSLMLTLDFSIVEDLQHRGAWATLGALLAEEALRLELAGADCVVLCTNTMHKVAGSIESAVAIPLLHIVDATASRLKGHNVERVGLLGTRFTMQDGFYQSRMKERFRVEVVTPSPEDQEEVHRIIYRELCQGAVHDASRRKLLAIIDRLQLRGVGGVILGCTELGLAISKDDTGTQLFDSTSIHAEKAVDFYFNKCNSVQPNAI